MRWPRQGETANRPLEDSRPREHRVKVMPSFSGRNSWLQVLGVAAGTDLRLDEVKEKGARRSKARLKNEKSACPAHGKSIARGARQVHWQVNNTATERSPSFAHSSNSLVC